MLKSLEEQTCKNSGTRFKNDSDDNNNNSDDDFV